MTRCIVILSLELQKALGFNSDSLYVLALKNTDLFTRKLPFNVYTDCLNGYSLELLVKILNHKAI